MLGLGYPTEVECSVGQYFKQDWVAEYTPQSCPLSSHVQIKFPATEKNASEVKMIWSDGGIRPFHPDLIPASDELSATGSSNGVIMIGTKGVMNCGVYGTEPKIYLPDGEVISMPEDFDSGNPNAGMREYGHQTSWVEAIKAGFDSKEHKALTSSFDYAGPMTETVLMGNLAIRSYTTSSKKNERGRQVFEGRKKLLWDGESMKITNYDPANRFVGREYRDGWAI